MLFLKQSERLNTPVHTDLNNSPDGFKYLGIKIGPKIEDLVPTNYDLTITSLIESINRWTLLHISLIGRINIVEMNILPKFLHLFQSLPLSPPPSFFPKIKKVITNLIWKNRKPRLWLTLLYLPYERGGLKLSNLTWYYWASQIRNAMCWFSDKSLPWVEIEHNYSITLI